MIVAEAAKILHRCEMFDWEIAGERDSGRYICSVEHVAAGRDIDASSIGALLCGGGVASLPQRVASVRLEHEEPRVVCFCFFSLRGL